MMRDASNKINADSARLPFSYTLSVSSETSHC
jgi:hypothetical protein